MRYRFDFPGARAIFALCIFAVLATAIWTRPAKWLGDFDQPFYLTIAYDIGRHGVFSNGLFDDVDSTAAVPPPGMFLAPLYPWLIVGATKIDGRFAQAVTCIVEVIHDKRDGRECVTYARPIHLIHALLLVIGVLAIARAVELMFASGAMFWLSGALATAAVAAEANLFSFVMTESLVFSLYSLVMLALVAAWTTGPPLARRRYYALAGLLLGMLCLARTAFAVLAPALMLLIFLKARFAGTARSSEWRGLLAFAICFAVIVFPWALRNQISVGKFTLTEEYGAASLIERFAFNRMEPREFALAFPYCVPAVGPGIVGALAGERAMDRFEWNTPGSFFESGRSARMALLAIHQRLDPVIGEITRTELAQNWWRHLLVSLPLAWCGLWIGKYFSLLLVPAFAWASFHAVRRATPLLLIYAAPAFVMLALHAALANHYTRYNVILISPFAAGAAWLIRDVWLRRRARSTAQSRERAS